MAFTCLPITSRFAAFITTFSIFTPRAPLTQHTGYLRSLNRIFANGHIRGRVTFKKINLVRTTSVRAKASSRRTSRRQDQRSKRIANPLELSHHHLRFAQEEVLYAHL